MAPKGKGSAKQFVINQFPKELKKVRTQQGKSNAKLALMMDGDERGVQSSLSDLKRACETQSVAFRKSSEAVAIFIPTWNIETWLAYFDGHAIEETRKNYPRLDKPNDCKKHVEVLVAMCHKQALRRPTPSALQAACQEYRSRLC